MAILPQDDKQLQQGQQNQNQPVDSTGGSAGGSVGGSMGAPGGTPATFGAGGSNAWTNIQSYLNANQGNTGSAQALSNKAGSSFDQEQNNLSSQSSQAKQQAQAQVDQNNLGQDKASQLVQDAASKYNYNNPQNDQYNQDVSQISGALNAKYTAPTSFNYALGADAQNYGQGMQNDQGFQGVMQNVYNQAGAGPMGSGSLALQNQLDTNNQPLNDARTALMGKYAGLQQNVNQTNADTDAAVKAAQGQFGQNQQELKDYLTGQAKTSQGDIDAAVSNFNSEQNAIINALKAGPGNTATWQATTPLAKESNVTGFDNQRSQFNAIQDALGLGGNKIAQDNQAFQLGDMNVLYNDPTSGSPTSTHYDQNQIADALQQLGALTGKDLFAGTGLSAPTTPDVAKLPTNPLTRKINY
jgi:hypothetical protein